MRRFSEIITADASGDATGYIDCPRDGLLHAIRYVKDGYGTGVDFVITLETTGAPVLTVSDVTASKTWYPRAQICDILGVDEDYNDESDEAVNDRIPVAGERIKIVVDEATASGAGTFYAWIDDK